MAIQYYRLTLFQCQKYSIQRVLVLVANAIYVAYGVMLDVPPIYIGCAIAVILHSYGIYMAMNEKQKDDIQYQRSH